MSTISPDAKRQLILDAAAEIVRSLGAEALNMGSLSSSVQLSRPAIYQYFASREHVLGELLLDEMADLSNELDRLLKDISDPMEQIRVWLHFSVAFMSSERHRFVADIPMHQLPEEQRGMLRAMHGFYTSSLISPLSELGVLDAAATANLVLGLVGAAAKRIEQGSPFTTEAQALEGFVMAGVDAARGAQA
jgi:AcrR family transcriptional regulator